MSGVSASSASSSSAAPRRLAGHLDGRREGIPAGIDVERARRAARRPRSAPLPDSARVPSVIARAARTVAPATSAGSSPAPRRTTRLRRHERPAGHVHGQDLQARRKHRPLEAGEVVACAADPGDGRAARISSSVMPPSPRPSWRPQPRVAGHVCQHDPVVRSQHLRGRGLDLRRTDRQIAVQLAVDHVRVVQQRWRTWTTGRPARRPAGAPPARMSRSGRELGPARRR